MSSRACLDETEPLRYTPKMILTQALALAALSSALAAEPAPKLPPVLPGWDGCKWTDPTHQTPKYVVGRIMASVPPSPNGIAAIVPAVNILYPGTKQLDSSGMDKVDIPCVGVIDMVVNSGGKEKPDSGDSWAWQVVTDKCGACKPNRCEEVSKSKKCAAAPAGAGSGAGGGLGPRPGGGSGGSGGTGGGGGSSGGAGGGAKHADQSEIVAEAKAELEAAGKDLSGPCGAFSIVKLAASRMSGGAGVLSKPSGNNCDGFATDIIAFPDGRIYDVLVGGGEANGPAWQDDGTVDPARYRLAPEPGQP
jgi:hypothetical protein